MLQRPWYFEGNYIAYGGMGPAGAQGGGVEGTQSWRVFAHRPKESGLELVDSEES